MITMINLDKNNYVQGCSLKVPRSCFSLRSDKVSFSGHVLSEKCGKLILKQQTSYFRELPTLKNVIDYLKTTFRGEVPDVLVGACSTGEEARSLKMLCGETPVNITAFDIGQDAIKRAKSGCTKISRYVNNAVAKNDIDCGFNVYQDAYLAFNDRNLSDEEILLKSLFDNYFKLVGEEQDKKTLGSKVSGVFLKLLGLKNNLFKEMAKLTDRRAEHRLFQLRNPENIEYVVGDINEISKFANDKKYHVITFRNALYHLVTDDYGVYRLPKDEKSRISIFGRIISQVKSHLLDKGLFVIGEHENTQMTDVALLSKMLKEQGFSEFVDAKGNVVNNIWRLLEG